MSLNFCYKIYDEVCVQHIFGYNTTNLVHRLLPHLLQLLQGRRRPANVRTPLDNLRWTRSGFMHDGSELFESCGHSVLSLQRCSRLEARSGTTSRSMAGAVDEGAGSGGWWQTCKRLGCAIVGGQRRSCKSFCAKIPSILSTTLIFLSMIFFLDPGYNISTINFSLLKWSSIAYYLSGFLFPFK